MKKKSDIIINAIILLILIILCILTDVRLQATKRELNRANIMADSLIMEGMYKDFLINQCKDTIYGEEPKQWK